jgi:Domain of unknown function (DUF4148)
MNSKCLYAATLAVSLISTLAMAEAAPVTRAQVNAELSRAIADGTLQRTDYDTGAPVATANSTLTREQVNVASLNAKAAKTSLNGSDANSSYNAFGAALRTPSPVTRAEVRSDVLQAAASGTLHRSDYDYDDSTYATGRSKAKATVSPTLAQRAPMAAAPAGDAS